MLKNRTTVTFSSIVLFLLFIVGCADDTSHMERFDEERTVLEERINTMIDEIEHEIASLRLERQEVEGEDLEALEHNIEQLTATREELFSYLDDIRTSSMDEWDRLRENITNGLAEIERRVDDLLAQV
jgi:SMC interacting uncharacterized protein involved in chromosome segregation